MYVRTYKYKYRDKRVNGYIRRDENARDSANMAEHMERSDSMHANYRT